MLFRPIRSACQPPQGTYADQYGVHVLKTVAVEDLKEDLAEYLIETRDGFELSVDFLGAAIHFLCDTKLVARGKVYDFGHTYAWFDSLTLEDLKELMSTFRSFLAEKQVVDKYLLANPYYLE